MVHWNKLPNGDVIVGNKESVIIALNDNIDTNDFYCWLDTSEGQKELSSIDGDLLVEYQVWSIGGCGASGQGYVILGY